MSANQKSITPLVLPQGPPVKSVTDYFISKKQTELMRILPECEPIGRGPGLASWRAHRDITSAREEFDETKIKYEERRKIMDDQWKELSDHQLMLKNAFEKFNGFIRENEDKRERSEQKISEDREALTLRTIDVENRREEIEELTITSNEMEKQLKKYVIYENYLNSVVEECTEFRTPMDIIHRFEALVTAKSKLSENQEDGLVKLENLTCDMSRLIEDKKVQIVGIYNKLSTLRTRYDEARNESKKMEVVLDKIKRETANRQSDLFRVRESLWALYLKICKNKGISPTCKKYDYEGQLVLVMRGLVEIKKIVKLAKEKADYDLTSNQAQISSE